MATAALGATNADAVEAHPVKRLDDGHAYFLVTFGVPGTAGAIVAVDAVIGTVLSSARLESVERAWLLGKTEAVAAAGGVASSAARLVWAPSRATLSPLYPLWEVGVGTDRVWVDRGGKVWRELPGAGPG